MSSFFLSPIRLPKSPISGSPLFTPSRRSVVIPPTAVTLGVLLAVICALWNAPVAQAQGVSFASTEATLGSATFTNANGFSSPEAIAVGASGNLFVVYYGKQAVYELLAVDGIVPASPTYKALGGGFVYPTGVTVDANGNVFVSESSTGSDPMREIPASCIAGSNNASCVVALAGFSKAAGLAVDGSGDVFAASSGEVKEILAVDGSIPLNPTIKTLGSGFADPVSVDVDVRGNVYVADYGSNTVKEIPASCIAGVNNATCVLTIGGGFSSPTAVAVDTTGNVYVADEFKAVKKIPASCITGEDNASCVETLSDDFSYPNGLAVDGEENIFVADTGGDRVVKLQTQSVSFGSVNVCALDQTPTHTPCSNTLTLTYNVTASGTLGTPKVVTQGAPNLDFKLANVSTCSGAVAAGTTCTVNVTFAPLYPGERSGAVEIVDGSGNLLTATNIYGTGLAPAIGFSPASQSKLVGGSAFSFGLPAGVATDGAGNIYVADFTKDSVYQMLAAGGYTTVNPLGGGFGFGGPAGVAVDGAGDVFVADFVNKAVYEILAAGGYTTVNTLGGGFSFAQPSDVALDASGNVFVSDLNHAVYEIPAAGGYSSVIQLATAFSFNRPSGLAVDGNDNVFVTDVSNNAVYEILAAGGHTTVNRLASSFAFQNLLGVAVSTSGNVFIADGNFSTILEIVAAGGYTTVLPVGSDLNSPQSVSLDASGNVYVPGAGTGPTVPASIQVIERSQPPALTFAATSVGSTSSDSPKSLQFENAGNQTLTGSGALTSYTDFNVVAGPGTVPDCNPETLSLAPGGVCNLSFDFTPQPAGPPTTTLTLSDNSLNGNPSTQAIQLSGIVAPEITNQSTTYSAVGGVVWISGYGFGATQGPGTVTYDGVAAKVLYWSNKQIESIVPSGAATGNLVVTAGGIASNGVAFTIVPPPHITGLSPSVAPAGSQITITGTNFGAYNRYWAVAFGAVSATLDAANWSDTSIIVTVPAGAVTGNIVVWASGAHSNAFPFVVGPAVEITNQSTTYSAVGGAVWISGYGFGAAQGPGTVTYDGDAAKVLYWSNTQIESIVPTGAASGDIVVTTGGGIASNGVAFTIVPPPHITGLSQSAAPVGTQIAITGTNFGAYNRYWAVAFGAVSAQLDAANWSDTSIIVTVPAGAVTGNLVVWASGSRSNAVPFTVTSPAD